MYLKYRVGETTPPNEVSAEANLPRNESYGEFCDFFIKKFLIGSQEGNTLYSVGNIYMMLSMLWEITAGSSRDQVSRALCPFSFRNIDTKGLLSDAKAFYASCQGDNEIFKSSMANSLWLSESITTEKTAVDSLANYYTQIYKGVADDNAYTEALQHWLKDKTGGLLDNTIEGITFSKDTLAALVSTFYLACAWYDKFDKVNTYEETFHGTKQESKMPFMHMTKGMNIFYGDNFTSVPKGISNGGNMWFVLPDEGVSIDEVIERGNIFNLITNPNQWDKADYKKVSMSLPKFDIGCDNDIIVTLNNLGIYDIFDANKANFTPLCKNDSIFVNKAQQASRIKIDEEGIEAASYTVMTMTRASLLPDDITEFNLDRPFIFAITNANNEILFIGVNRE